MFCDEALIEVSAGNGGNGLVSFRHSRHKAHGGPNGGDGGRGGDVYFRVNPNLNTLSKFLSKKFYQAENGEDGKKENCRGKSGEDLIIEVPEGTLLVNKQNGGIISDISQENPEVLVVKGGRGGFGNAHFATSRRQAPKFAEKGELGESMILKLELKLVAEVGIIGYPSVGKSTLISVISNAKPKIAEYEFTTIVPNLGVVRSKDYEFVVCDIPGLIDGASAGKGLGHKFLKHIERCKMLLHLIDITREDIFEDFDAINRELEIFNPSLISKPQIAVINKIDTIDKKKLLTKIKKLKKHSALDVIPISAVTGEGVEELLNETANLLRVLRRKEIKEEKDVDYKVFKPHLEDSFKSKEFSIDRKDAKWLVKGKRIEQIANMTDWSNDEAVGRFHDILRKMNITKELMKRGVRTGDMIYVGSVAVEFVESLPK